MIQLLFLLVFMFSILNASGSLEKWPPLETSAVASVEYFDDNMLYHKFFVYWEHTDHHPKDEFIIKDTNGVIHERIIFDSLLVRHEFEDAEAYRLLALHHFRESLMGSVLQLEDLRLITEFNFGLPKNDSIFSYSSSYTKVITRPNSLKLYSHKNELSKIMTFSDYNNFHGYRVPQTIRVEDVNNSSKRAIIHIENIAVNAKDALLQLLLSRK
ncbi:MAG: outer membrane lipoprotein-sorting protein [Fibrobacterales bacterium]